MTDLGARESGSGNGLPDLANIVGNGLRVRADIRAGRDALGRVAVEVFAAHRDAVDCLDQGVAMLPDSRLEGEDLVGEGRIASRSPQAQKQRGACVESRRNGRNDVASCAGLLLGGGLPPVSFYGTVKVTEYSNNVQSWCRGGHW